jgi:hypothetical protein
VLGEAAAQLSSELKDRFPDIMWQQPARLRNRIVHGYWSIDMEILHTTATDQLPAFASGLRKVLHVLTAAEHRSAEDAGANPAGSGTAQIPTSVRPDGGSSQTTD